MADAVQHDQAAGGLHASNQQEIPTLKAGMGFGRRLQKHRTQAGMFSSIKSQLSNHAWLCLPVVAVGDAGDGGIWVCERDVVLQPGVQL